MKKYILPVFVLSIIGGFISIILIIQHYNINSEIVTFFCGDLINNLCRDISLTEYSTLFNFPVAVYGLLFYSFILIVTIIFFYTGEEYSRIYVIIIFPLALIAIVVSIAFIIIMIKIRVLCTLCLLIHLINFLLFCTSIIFYKYVNSNKDFKISVLIEKYTNTLLTVSHARAALAAFTAFIIFFIFSIFSISKIIDLRTGGKISYNVIKQYLARYERSKPEDLKLHNTSLVAGNQEAKLTITVFSDFLCSYCYRLYKVEEYLLIKFRDKIKFEYYSYPLDKQCNVNVRRTVYANSCIASKAMLASSKLGIFEEYMKEHFKNYKNLKSEYTLEKALMILSDTGNDAMKDRFIQLINSGDISAMLQKDIKSAKKNKINATPTIFIANKRIGGMMPAEVFGRIISKELQRLENKNQDD